MRDVGVSSAILLGAVSAVLAGAARPAAAGPATRTITASARTLGCTSAVALPCESATPSRAGNTVSQLAWRAPGGTSPVAIVHSAAAPVHGELASQVIAAAGVEQRVGRRGWLHVGAGVAAGQRGPGPRAITTAEVLDQAAPALVAGAGLVLDTPVIRGLEVALDVGASIQPLDLARVHQLTASVSRRF